MSNEKSCASTSINWFPGHMKKTMEQIQKRFKTCRHSSRTIRC